MRPQEWAPQLGVATPSYPYHLHQIPNCPGCENPLLKVLVKRETWGASAWLRFDQKIGGKWVALGTAGVDAGNGVEGSGFKKHLAFFTVNISSEG